MKQNEFMVYGCSLPQAYHNALRCLQSQGMTVDCPGYSTRCKEVSMTMCVNHPLMEPRISKCGIFGPEDLQQYCMEMLDGVMDFEVDKGKWAYTYHKRMANYFDLETHTDDQIENCIRILRENPSSRRAVIDVRENASDMFSDDPSCLQNIQLLIRDGKLDCKVLFRSNDAMKATFMNAFALVQLQERIANELGVSVGTYTHRANSFHCYERDWPMLAGCVGRIVRGENMTYDYAGDWKEQMDAAVPGILEKVVKLKGE